MGFNEQCLKTHNELRAKHGCPPLKINAKLSKYAKEWADNLAKRDTMQHRPNPKYGENIFFSSGKKNVSGDVPAQMWYDEIKDYNFDTAEFSPAVGHFTQLVWKNTKEVGIGVATKKDKTWVVANYNPPGNFVGQFKEQVPKTRS